MAENNRTKRDTIAGELRTLILSGELPRETRMQQDELARRFNSSITPVREALGLLQAEGLVVSEPHRGVRVASLDLERLKSIYVARRLLETYAVRRAMSRMSPRDVSAAEAILAEIERVNADGGSTKHLRELNRKFHFFLYDRCGLAALVKEIEDLWRMFPWDLNLAEFHHVANAAFEHKAIVTAIKSGDVDSVSAAVGEHIKNGFLAIVARMTGEQDVPDPFELDVD